ncbi:MAG TPA: hypothetical protein VIJ46_05295 [Rhabdochlamydiaceae bacterium]
MNHLSFVRDRSPERTPMGSPESPAANADTRAIITWLMQVQYHGGIASEESRSTLLALARALPAGADISDPHLASVVTAIRNVADAAIYDPLLANKAGNAIDSLTAKLSSPVRVISPIKRVATAAAHFSGSPGAARKLNFDQVE